MNKTLPIWRDNVVAVQLLSNKLTFLRDMRGSRKSRFVADLYEQELVPNPETGEISPPCKLREVTEDQVPLAFLQSSGGQCWRLSKQQKVRGYWLILENKRLCDVVGVEYAVLYDYQKQAYTRPYLELTSELFAFKEWSSLKAETFCEGRRVLLAPVYLYDKADEGAYFVRNNRVLRKNAETEKDEAVRCFGVNVYEVSLWGGTEKFSYFLPAERLPEKGFKDLRF